MISAGLSSKLSVLFFNTKATHTNTYYCMPLIINVILLTLTCPLHAHTHKCVLWSHGCGARVGIGGFKAVNQVI